MEKFIAYGALVIGIAFLIWKHNLDSVTLNEPGEGYQYRVAICGPGWKQWNFDTNDKNCVTYNDNGNGCVVKQPNGTIYYVISGIVRVVTRKD